MTTPRIAPVSPDKASLLTRLVYRYAKRRFGQVPEPFAVYAHHRGLLIAGAASYLKKCRSILHLNSHDL